MMTIDGSESPKSIKALGKRKRELSEDPRVKPEVIDSSDSDSESESEDEEDLIRRLYDDNDKEHEKGDIIPEEDIEPEQGEVQWSEDHEDLPPCPAYHTDVGQIKKRIMSIFNEVIKELSYINDKSEALRTLSRQAADIQNFPQPKPLVVAFLGNAGAGKSALMCSILDIAFISRESASGRSCTCVITEYRKCFAGQVKRFSAKIDFLSTEQISELLKDHLQDYIQYNFEFDQEWTAEDRKDFYSRAKTAEGTFLDLFRGKSCFRAHDEMKSYLQRMWEKNEESIVLTQLERWCGELVASQSVGNEAKVLETDTAFQLDKALKPVLSSNTSGSKKASMWPLVHKVTIGIRGPKVLENMIFADLPGISDTNRVRVDASKNYLLSSDYLWIVSPLARCITDTAVDSLLDEYGGRFKDRIALICTKADDTGSVQGLASEYPGHARPCQKLEMIVKEARNARTEARASARRATKPATVDARNKLADQCHNRYQQSRRQLLELMVKIRSDELKSAVYAERPNQLKKGDMDSIYCVSNKHYSWLKGYKEACNADIPEMRPKMTGIPDLRQYALRVPAQDIWVTFMNHIQHTSMAFIKALRIWAGRTGAEGNTGFLDIRAKSSKTLKDALKDHQALIADEARKLLVDPLLENYREFAAKASAYLLERSTVLHWCTLKAFIRREGTYTSKVAGSDSWNEKMMIPAVIFMNSRWEELVSEEAGSLEAAKIKIVGGLDVILSDLKETMQELQIPMGHFEGFLEAQKHGIAHAFVQYQEEFDKKIKNLIFKATKDHATGIFARVMRPIYQEAEEMKGSGYKARVTTFLMESVNAEDNDSPFNKMAKDIGRQVNIALNESTNELQVACDKIFDEVFKQFGCLIYDAPDPDGSIAEVKSSLKDFLATADKEMSEMVLQLQTIEKNPRPESSAEKPRKAKKKVRVKSEPVAEDDRKAKAAAEDKPKVIVKLEED